MSTETVPKGYKRTEVGVIPEEWQVVSLSQTARRITRGASPRPIDSPVWFDSRSTVGWVRISDVTSSGRHLLETSQRLSKSGIERSRPVPAGSLIMSICATVGRPIETRIDTCIHDGFVVFEQPLVDQSHLYHVLKELEPTWSKRGQTGSQMNLNTGLINDCKIAIPSTIAEQQAIAAALSDADALIESLEQLIAKKRQIKQGAMQELLTGKCRLPGFTGKWAKSTLHDIASIQRGASPRPIDDPVWFDDQSEIGWVRISDVTQSGMYLCETTQKLSGEGVKRSRLVQSGNLIMSICATVGRPVITEITACIHDGFVVFDNLQVDKFFLYYFLISIEDDWSKHGQTGSQMNLNTGLINSTPIPVPPLPEQSAIASVLSDMDAELEVLEGKLDKTQQVKQGMMQQLLTGKVRLV